MEYKLIVGADVNHLKLFGEIDLHSSPELRKIIMSAVDSSHKLEVDLSQVSYLDSSGVACFVEAYQLSKNNKLDFSLQNISEPAMQVIKLARLDQVFPIK